MAKATRRQFLTQVGLGGAALALGGLAGKPARAASPGSKPNFLFILLDDMGWADPAYKGNPFHQTPNIDRLAREGVVFTDGYAPAPFCAPARTAFITGQHAARVYWKGVDDLEDGDREYRAVPWQKVVTEKQNWTPPDLHMLPEALNDAGYVTGHVGKWHVANWRDRGPREQGFQKAWGGGPGCGAPDSYFPPYGIPDSDPEQESGYLTERVADEAVAFLKENGDTPFYLQVWHYNPHTPIEAKSEYVAKFREKGRREAPDRNPTYAAMIKSADDSVGRLLDTLDELGIADNTVVVFSSDNGGLAWLGYERVAVNDPLRGEKGMLWEGGIRVPFAVRWPAVAKPGSVCRTPVTFMDLYPTFINLAGGSFAAGQAMDGADLTPLLRGEEVLADRPLFWYDPVYRVRKEEISTPSVVVRQGDYKLIKSYHYGLSLYNLRDDIGETTNLVESMPEKAAELEKLADEWMVAVGVCPPFPNVIYDPSAPIPRQVERFTPAGASLVRAWDFSKEEDAWRAARWCETESTGEALRVNFTGSYPEIAGDVEAPAGVYVAVIRYRYPTNGRFRFHWNEGGNRGSGTVELYPEDDGDWHEVAALFEARHGLAYIHLAAGVNRMTSGWNDPELHEEFAELKEIRLYRVNEDEG